MGIKRNTVLKSIKKTKLQWLQLYGTEGLTIYLFIYLFIYCLFMAAPTTNGGSQARGLIRAVSTGLCHSHSNMGFKPHL